MRVVLGFGLRRGCLVIPCVIYRMARILVRRLLSYRRIVCILESDVAEEKMILRCIDLCNLLWH